MKKEIFLKEDQSLMLRFSALYQLFAVPFRLTDNDANSSSGYRGLSSLYSSNQSIKSIVSSESRLLKVGTSSLTGGLGDDEERYVTCFVLVCVTGSFLDGV